MTAYKTEQEKFWATEFGDEYIGRNTTDDNYPTRLNLFSKVFESTTGVNSVFEFGANIGNNLYAIHSLLPKAEIKAIEINKEAHAALNQNDWMTECHLGSILENSFPDSCDFSFTSGVMIHINPDELPKVYKALYEASRKYVMVCEYYNPKPVSIPYHGHDDRLFKRDFAGEMMDTYPDLKLVDYGFCYHRDVNFPADDLNWFLMEKRK